MLLGISLNFVNYFVRRAVTASWSGNVEVKNLNENQVQRKFGTLIIGKTTGYAARWLYRLLMKNCISGEQ